MIAHSLTLLTRPTRAPLIPLFSHSHPVPAASLVFVTVGCIRNVSILVVFWSRRATNLTRTLDTTLCQNATPHPNPSK